MFRFSLARLKKRLPVAATITLASTTVVALAAPAIAAGQPSVKPPTVSSVGVAAAGFTPRAPGETEKGLKGDQQNRSINAGGGNYTATSLSPSATWQVSGQTGEFTWSYPLPVTPVPGGVQPALSLSYSSSAVDGLTSATNNQASWIGDGWAMWPGFIERTYESCSRDVDDTPADNPQDLCWRSDNATMSLNGSGTALILDDTSKVWKAKSDNGERIERLGSPNDRNESWQVTTTDGTQYFFGSRPESKSAWKVPVFGDDENEPCHNGGFATSVCVDQIYRWNLDKVISRTGDMMVYNYETEKNTYSRNKGSVVTPYDRGGWLANIEYGLRADREPAASGRVTFETAERCVPDANCTWAQPDNLPDVPLFLNCEDGVCKDRWSPSFWTSKRLATITTHGRVNGEWKPVDSWSLRHVYPDPGDGERPAMWLAGIKHTGHTDKAPITLPEVTFEGKPKPNRVYTVGDGYSKLIRFRMNAIVSEAGGVTGIDYAEPDCTSTTKPAAPESNTQRCFPAKWAAPMAPERTDYFHKYVVSQVSALDRIGDAVATTTRYVYPEKSAAWHYDDSEFTPDPERTWNSFRGFATVTVLSGNGEDGPRAKTVQSYYRGMHGDKQPSGTRTVEITDSENGKAYDEDWLSGRLRESTTYLGETDTVVSKTITEPYFRPKPTATRGTFKAYLVRPGTTRTFTPLKAGGRWETRTENKFDEEDVTGSVIAVNDLGDVSTPADDRCTRTTFDRRTDTWLMNLPARIETVAVNCDATPVFPRDAISDVVTTFDGAGNPTEIKQLAEHPASGPVYVSKIRTSSYDVHGRALELLDAKGRKSTVGFTPATGGPMTEYKTTDAAGFSTTTSVEALRGAAVKVVEPNGRTVDMKFDALGRTVEVWAPDRDRRAKGNAKYSYEISRDAPNAIRTERLAPNGNHITTTQVFDGLLRPRQTQTPTNGGRLLTDIRYDSQGRAFRSTSPFFNNQSVDMKLWQANNIEEIPAHTLTRFDGAGRPVEQAFMAPDLRWKTTTSYEGDRVVVTPPAGGTVTTTIADPRGHVTAQQTHAGNARDTTGYLYNTSGQLAEMTDPGGNKWKFGYDLLGRMTSREDPVRGTSTVEYNEVDEPIKSTDARGVVLTYDHDPLGRQTSVSQGTVKLAEWTYDTADNGKGMPATSTRYADGHAYTTKIAGYDAGGRPDRTEVTIPAVEGGLAGTYVTQVRYGPDGTPISGTLPRAGRLDDETMVFSYDDLGRPTTTTSSYDGQTNYASDSDYSPYGELERLQYGDEGSRVWLTYLFEDRTRRPQRTIVDTETSKPMQADVRYTYDPAGNITSISDETAGQAADTQCFRYDHLRRLTEAWTPKSGCSANPAADALGGPAKYWQSFTYDKVGNRLTDTLRGTANDATRSYEYAGMQQKLLSSTVRVGSQAATSRYEYDLAGNTKRRNDQVLDWGPDGRLETVADKDAVTKYVYTAEGERLIRRDPKADTLYLGAQEIRLDKATGAKTATRYYGHAGRTVAMRADDGKLTWFAGDHQGTSQISVDTASLSVTRRRQLPFGEPRGPQPAFPGDKGFVGGINDPSTGLTTLGARQYDSATGRFLSPDAISDPADSQQVHGYTYSNNNPVTFSDPTGLYFEDGLDDLGNPRGIRNNPDGSKTAIGSATPEERDYGNGIVVERDGNGGGYINHLHVKAEDVPDFELLVSEMNMLAYKNQLGARDENGMSSDARTGSIMLWGCKDMAKVGKRCGSDFEWAVDIARYDDPTFPKDGNDRGGMASLRSLICDYALEHNSFTPDTMVVMADGSRKPIKDVQVGDEVLATDAEAGRTEKHQVIDTRANTGEKHLVEITIDTDDDAGDQTGTVTATERHPIWSADKQTWLYAGELRPGDHVLTSAGTTRRITEIKTRTEFRTVHNLTVDTIHTYYVSAGGQDLLTHNFCAAKKKKKTNTISTKDKRLSDSNPVPNYLRNAYERILQGDSSFRREELDQNGNWVPEVHQGREDPDWAGAEVYNVPGGPSDMRLLRKGHRMGYVVAHRYKAINPFPAPWYPDGGEEVPTNWNPDGK